MRKGWLFNLRPFLTASNVNPLPFGSLIEQREEEAPAGGLYVLPYVVNLTTVLCNTELFAAEGIRLPGLDWTWTEFLMTAKRLTRSIGGVPVRGLAASYWGLVEEWLPKGTAAPSPEEFRQALGQVGGRAGAMLRVPSFLLPTTGAPGQTEVFLHVEQSAAAAERWSAFARGRVAMIMTGMSAWWLSRVARQLPVRWTAVPTPHFVGVSGEVGVGASVLGAAAATRAPEAVWTFINWAAGPDGIVAFNPTGVPAYRSPQSEARWLAAARPATGLRWVFHTPLKIGGNLMAGGVLVSNALFDGINGVLYQGWSIDKAVTLYETALRKAGVRFS